MKKKYLYLILILVIMLIFTSTSNASFSSFKQRIYDKFQVNSTFQIITDIISNTTFLNDTLNNILDTNITNITNRGITSNYEFIDYDNQENNTILGRIISIISQRNEKFGLMLQRIVKNVVVFNKIV